MENVFSELQRYVDFNVGNQASLRAFHPVAQPRFPAIAAVFYDRILAHPEARKALEGGESTVGQLKVKLQAWMDLLLRGPWDDAYYETRARIGRVHVRIALPQHYMFGAMNVIRQQFNLLVDEHYAGDPIATRDTRLAVGKILDLELAIMLHTYREDLLAAQARAERLATFGQLVGSIGHELRNPLAVMESSLHILRGQVQGNERAQKHAERIGAQLLVANRIVTNLLDMIRDRPLAVERIKLDAVVASAAEAAHLGPEIRLVKRGLEALPEVGGDPVQLRQVLLNLLENAAQAMGERGEIRISGEAGEGAVEVAVEDTGPGVSAAAKARLFEPLNTTKVRGIGLGLALVKRILERHHGAIRYEPRDAGARFVIRLPRGR